MWQNSDIKRLGNGDRLPLFTAASCMNGWVSHPLKPVAMGELWLTHSGGGGVAAWLPTGLEPLGGQAALMRAFYPGLYDGRGRSLGELTAAASTAAYARSGGYADVIREYLLLGDPALVVSGVPLSPDSLYVPYAVH
jgi:hypothetical protein